MPKHKRGGLYSLQIIKDVTNWNGILLDRQILNNLCIGDIVRVIFEPYNATRYIEITNILSNGYFKGFINDPYNGRYCNICRQENIKGDSLYHCPNVWICDYDCHLSCLKKHYEQSCKCNLSLLKHKQYLLNNSIIIFKKNNICEIPNWSKNTQKQINIYKNS